MRPRICPGCGRTSELFVEGLCPDCFSSRKPLVRGLPQSISAELCRICGSVRVKGRWLQARGFDDAVRIVVESMQLKPLPPIEDARISGLQFETIPDWRTRVRLKIEGRVGSAKLSQEVLITVSLKPSICPTCTIRRSGEYDTLVQVRGEGDLVKLVEKALEKLGEWSSLVEVVESGEGVDVYFTHRGAASRFLKMLSRLAKVKSISSIEHELVGLSSSGRPRSRKSIVIRVEGADSH